MTDPAPAVPNDEATRALKERIYATFTGLAVLAGISTAGHSTAPEALLTLLVSVLGISIAGFLAEVVAHQVSHRGLPGSRELWVMARIALGALASASAPILVLAAAWAGLLTLEHALWFGTLVYALTLVAIFFIAAHRSGLKPVQQLVSAGMLIGLAVIVIGVLSLAH